MGTFFRSRAIALALLLASGIAAATPTARCSVEPRLNQAVLEFPLTNALFVESIAAAVLDPESNPSLYERLSQPISVVHSTVGFAYLSLGYDRAQDIGEIVVRLRADADFAAQFQRIDPVTFGCVSSGAARTQTITEYYNEGLNHYFMSSSPQENASLDSGGAGPGWRRTGQAWTTHEATPCDMPSYRPVYRFYGTPGIGPNSHFYTVNPDECGGLRQGVGWGFEGFAFGAQVPIEGQCPQSAPVALLRLYNNRFTSNDSNHRYTSDPATYGLMQAQGWIGEGVQLCVKAAGAPPACTTATASAP